MDQFGKYHRFEQPAGSCLAHGQIKIEVRKTGSAGRHEILAWNFEHCRQDPQICDVGGADLTFHHVAACGDEVDHQGPRLEQRKAGSFAAMRDKTQGSACDCRKAFAPI